MASAAGHRLVRRLARNVYVLGVRTEIGRVAGMPGKDAGAQRCCFAFLPYFGLGLAVFTAIRGGTAKRDACCTCFDSPESMDLGVSLLVKLTPAISSGPLPRLLGWHRSVVVQEAHCDLHPSVR